METKESAINNMSHLPSEMALKIASCLPDQDVCRLGSCNGYWREICGSDPIWISLSKKRWPSHFTQQSTILGPDPPTKDYWKSFYAEMHKEVRATINRVLTLVNECVSHIKSVDCSTYSEVYRKLALVKFEFTDVKSFLFNTDSDISVILNLLGLHYSINFLQVQPEVVGEALRKHKA